MKTRMRAALSAAAAIGMLAGTVAVAAPAQAWGGVGWSDCWNGYSGSAGTMTKNGNTMWMYSSTYRDGAGCSNYTSTGGPGINGVCSAERVESYSLAFLRIERTRTTSHNGACHWSRTNGNAVWT